MRDPVLGICTYLMAASAFGIAILPSKGCWYAVAPLAAAALILGTREFFPKKKG